MKKKDNIDFDWMMKLKTNKTLTKTPKVKMRNQKNKEHIGKKNMTNCNLRTNWKHKKKLF